MSNPYQVIKDFEQALCDYTGAPYAVAVNSCTNALLLACEANIVYEENENYIPRNEQDVFSVPRRTYVGVPQSIKRAGGKVVFDDREWVGFYDLKSWNIWDSARYFEKDMFNKITDNLEITGKFICVSFHRTKILSIGNAGAILHNSDEVCDRWLRKARFDGRSEGIPPNEDNFDVLGHHCMIDPRDAEEGLLILSTLPAHNDPIPNSDYPDLSQFEVFK